MNTPEKLATVKWVKENYFDYYTKRKLDAFTAEFGNGMTNPFVSGKVAMIAQTATEFTKVRDFAPDKITAWPSFPSSKKAQGTGPGAAALQLKFRSGPSIRMPRGNSSSI